MERERIEGNIGKMADRPVKVNKAINLTGLYACRSGN